MRKLLTIVGTAIVMSGCSTATDLDKAKAEFLCHPHGVYRVYQAPLFRSVNVSCNDGGEKTYTPKQFEVIKDPLVAEYLKKRRAAN